MRCLHVKKAEKTMRTQDMTQGDPLRLIFGFAIPLFIGNIFQQLYTIADTMVVGRGLGDSAIAAIGATSALYNLLINFAWGMNSGCGIVVTQCFGAHDEKKLRQSIAGMLLLDGAVTAMLTVLSLLFMGPLLRYMNTPDSIFDQARVYIAIICAGMVFTIGYNMCAAILRAVGNSKAPLYFLIVSSLLNITLDVLAVLVFQWGVAGAALATVAAQAVSALFCGLYLVRSYRSILPRREDFRPVKSIYTELAATGFSMALMVCVVDLGSTIFQRANNLLGEVYITAYTAVRRLHSMMVQPISTIANANATFIGQNWGAKKPERIMSALKKVVLLEVLYGLSACIVIYLFGGTLVRFTTGTANAEVVSSAVMGLRIHFAGYPVLAILLCLRTAMQAMGRKTAPVISSGIELAMKIVSAWLLIPQIGFLGTCVTEPVTWVLMTAFLAAAYWLGQKKRPIRCECKEVGAAA